MSRRVGYRFHPTDEELVDYFLKHKMDGYDFLVDDDIPLIDLYKFEPWDLPSLATQGSNDQVWYFFCRRELKYKNASRPRFNRSTNTGHWKLTGHDHPVKAKATNKKIGTKRTYVFYMRSSPKEVRTNWVFHEYEPKALLPHQKDFVLCKLKEKADDKVDTSACDEGEASHFNNIHLVDTPIQQVDAQLLLETFFPGNGVNFNPPSSLQPQIHISEDISLDDLMFNGVFDNDLGGDTNEPQEDPNEMADSFILALSSDGSNHEETALTHLNCSGSPQSGGYLEDTDDLTGVYLEDMEDLHSNIVHTRSPAIPSLNNGPANSKEYRHTRRVHSITETLPSSTYNQSGKEKNNFHSDEILVMGASCSSADSYEKINCVGVVGKEFSVHMRNRMNQQQSRYGNIEVEKEVTPKTSVVLRNLIGTSKAFHPKQSISGNIKVDKEANPKSSIVQGKMSGASEYKAREARRKGTALDPAREPPKENINVKIEKEFQMANVTSLKLRDNAITGNNKTGSFIRLETSLLSQRSPPLSVYVVNLVIALFLFIYLGSADSS